MDRLNKLFNKYSFILIFFLVLFQSYFYVNHITHDYKLMNEYRYINEITLLDGKEVSNAEYINNNLLFNPNESQKYNSSRNIFLDDKKNKGFSFNNIVNSIIMPDYKINSYNALNKWNSFKDIQFSKSQDNLYSDFIKNKHASGNIIDNIFKNYPMFQADSISKLKEKMDFIKDNIYEQNMQIFDRYYINENSFMLSPINEMRLGKNDSEIFSQYGFLSMSIIDKVMDIYGGFSINNYEKAKKTIDLFYFLLAVSFIFYFFKDSYVRFGFILFLGIALFGNGYYPFSYAPTVTNSRHLLDLLIIALLFGYTKTLKKTYMIGAVFLSILSIFIAKDFGQFIFLATIGTISIPLVIKYIEYKIMDRFNSLMLLITIIFGTLAFKYYPMMENPSIKYFLDGFYSFPFSNRIIFPIVLSIVFLQWLLLLTLYKKLEQHKYLYPYIFSLLYTQFLYTYFIWHGTLNDIVIYLYIFALPLMIVYSLYDFKYKKYLSLLIIFALFLAYGKVVSSFIKQKNDYDNVFKTHKLYKWNQDRAGGIITTYSFDGFQDSINLIKKYNGSDKIYMISKYDNILAILSEKYSGFKFFELRSSIVTEQEYAEVKSTINSNAQILFVDNDIDRDFDAEMQKMSFFDLYPFWRNESLKQRIPKLKVLQNLFYDVKNNYELVEKGSLISVYKRKK